MMSSKVTLPEEEGGADVDGAEQDGAVWERGAIESNYHDQGWASLHLTIA